MAAKRLLGVRNSWAGAPCSTTLPASITITVSQFMTESSLCATCPRNRFLEPCYFHTHCSTYAWHIHALRATPALAELSSALQIGKILVSELSLEVRATEPSQIQADLRTGCQVCNRL